jgi:hypothetical protein
MNDSDARDILEKIMELAALIGWETVIVQNSQGQVIGLYAGSSAWIEYKNGPKDQKPTH